MSASLPINGTTNLGTVFGRLDPANLETVLTLDTGEAIRLPTDVLLSYLNDDILPEPNVSAQADVLVIPVLEEQLDVQKREVVTGTVRLQKVVEEREVLVDEPLEATTYAIERVPLNLEIAVAPGIRQEGETTIYPVVEEVVVVHKKLLLREEVRVTRQTVTTRNPQVMKIRVEDVIVERSELQNRELQQDELDS
ncbi:hypothetical protein ACPOL_6804 (plasmid) [Acidisarcina polymorpha]|uniref:DUF2382 domain-containing protein n=1 Tax=Acidisarcina polymorpha TaxID=2211140 RepID=A0A2Z5GBC8_9BACT|nr:YsnF/AvaK domain-containing protein [Acidisarcina polymorpha]AXC16014.1 hypothetical protein ACPOL_6804 [Acidisarcina polymorpha]